MPLNLEFDLDQLTELCRRYHVIKLELFGSRARGLADDNSDVDLLVTFEDGIDLGLSYFAFPIDLEALFGVPVDIIERDVIESDRNPYFKKNVFEAVETLYAA